MEQNVHFFQLGQKVETFTKEGEFRLSHLQRYLVEDSRHK